MPFPSSRVENLFNALLTVRQFFLTDIEFRRYDEKPSRWHSDLPTYAFYSRLYDLVGSDHRYHNPDVRNMRPC